MTIQCNRNRCRQNAIVTISTGDCKKVLARSLTYMVRNPKNKTQVNYCLRHYPTATVGKVLDNIKLSKITDNQRVPQDKKDFNTLIKSKQKDSLTLSRLDKLLENLDSKYNPMEEFSTHEIALYIDNYF